LTRAERRTGAEAHRELPAHPGAPLSHALHESAVELERLALEQPSLDFDAPFAQRRGAASVDLGVGIGGGIHHARHARLEQRLDAGGRAAVMAAGLERHVHRSPRGLRSGGLERLDLGVCLAGALVPALADDALALRDHAADARIRVGAGEAPLGEAEGALHGLAVELGGRAHGCPLAPAPCSGWRGSSLTSSPIARADTSRSPRLRTLCTTRLTASSICSRGTGRFSSAFSMPARSFPSSKASRPRSPLITIGITSSADSKVVKRSPHFRHSRRRRI